MTELDSKIEQVLKDLYQIDPLFKKHEAKIKAIIREVLLSKPDTKFDEAFAKSLRHKILVQADLLKEKSSLSLLKSANWLKRTSYALGFVALTAIVTAGSLYYKDRQKPPSLSNTVQLLSGKVQINKQAENAFGKLALSAAAGLGGNGGGGAENAALPQNDTAAKSASPAAPAPLGMGGGGTDAYIMPPFANYQYVYKGEEFSIDQDKMEVYRRIKTAATGADVSSLLRNMNFGIVDIGSFSNLTLQNMNFAEDKDFGYMFYVNLLESSISASENWQRWPTPDRQCKDPQCYESFRMKMSDIPSDQELIAMTGRFLTDHGIPTENYDAPVVDNYWKIAYENATDKANSYIPNILSVVYPLRVNGKVIYDEGGRKTGLYVSVDVLAKKVSGFSELYAQNYDSSTYAVENDKSKLISLAEKGGMYGGVSFENAARTLQVELGTPTLAYVKHYQYPQIGGISEELLVPALIFPVTKTPQDYPMYQRNIVILLPTDFQQQETGGPIKIMPAQ